jgi:hypothetical protein
MLIIAHRGNVSGPNEAENSPKHIDAALSLGYDAEVDVHVENNHVFLGHDCATYPVDLDWLTSRKSRLWIHCKNFNALRLLSKTNLHYFYHTNDDYTITSLGYIWTYPGQRLGDNFILVMPESVSIASNPYATDCFAVCTDFSNDWNKK